MRYLPKIGPQLDRVHLRKPVSLWIPIPDLIAALSKILPPKAMKEITQYRCSYIHKISRRDMIQGIREFTGDRLLLMVLKDFTEQTILATLDYAEVAANLVTDGDVLASRAGNQATETKLLEPPDKHEETSVVSDELPDVKKYSMRHSRSYRNRKSKTSSICLYNHLQRNPKSINRTVGT
ncbi:hypothetical protein L6452_40428 [Arctium lappa]|uniref:Uncharacterized protein n=1 Tax=Arctium lappa TaxID=4217 RepID=A0ACB8XMQ7_ARCLA|nr:hypothetical protein L6452_40428 [Arctium lappa]